MRTRALLLAIPLLVAAACGDDDQDPVVADQGATTTTVAAAAQTPERIVSISPTSTEVLFAVGAGDLVVAVDDQSTFPEDAPMTDLSAYEPNVEAIASYEPDLVVTSSSDPAVNGALEALDIEVLVHEAAVELDDVYAQIEEIGAITGHDEEAAELVEEMQTELDDIEAVSADRPALTAYWELDPTYYSVTSSTFIGKLLSLVNVTSIADEAQAEANDYPQLSAEFIVQADPDLVLLADTKCCDQSLESVKARPGWETMKAVQTGNVVALDDDVASRWGPRIVDLVRQIADAAESAATAG